MSEAWRPQANIWLIALVVTLGAFMEVLDTTIVNVALPHIAGSLSVSNDDSTWALTVYLVANGIVLTISGALGRLIGRKKFFMICIAVFTIASLGCGLSQNFGELLFFRAVQGFFGGGLQPTQQSILLDTFPPDKRQQAFSLTAIAIVVAPVLGPLLGGYLTDRFTWHLIFLINVPIGLLTFFGVWRMVEDSPRVKEEQKTAPPLDYVGIGLIAIALGFLELVTDRGEDLDWLGSSFILEVAALSALGFIFGVGYLLVTKNPVVDLRVFKDRNFTLGFIQVGIMGVVLYASAVLIPQFAQQQLGYTATLAGLVLAPGAVVLILLIPIVGKILDVVPAKYVIAAGGLALASSLFYSEHLVPYEDFNHLMVARATQAASLALLFVPISTVAYATLKPSQQGDAAALFSMSRNVFGGIGISVSTALVTERLQGNQQNLIQHLSGADQNYNLLIANVQQALVNTGASMGQALRQAPIEVTRMLQLQTGVLAYNDVFLITGCLALLMIPTALLLSGVKKSGGGPG